MDRKEFLRTAACVGGWCAVGAPSSPQEDAPTPCAEKLARARAWVKRLAESADATLDQPARARLMEAQGRACARGGAIKAAEACQGDVDKLVATLAGWVGKDRVRREGQVVRVSYGECFCPIVSEMTEPLSPSHCLCSTGWLKEMFETVSHKDAQIEILETVKRGGKECRFLIRLV